MKKHLLSAFVLAVAATGLAACETYYGNRYAGGYGYGGYGYADSGYSYYDGYYDNYYGPVSYGYWGPDNYFYYSTVVGGPIIRDDARHFRRTTFEGARQFHMRGRPQMAPNRRDRDRDYDRDWRKG